MENFVPDFFEIKAYFSVHAGSFDLIVFSFSYHGP